MSAVAVNYTRNRGRSRLHNVFRERGFKPTLPPNYVPPTPAPVVGGPAGLAALNEARNKVYAGKVANWRANVAAGKVNLTPATTRKQQAQMTRNNFYRELMAMEPTPAPVYPPNYKPWSTVEAEKQVAAEKAARMQAWLAEQRTPMMQFTHRGAAPRRRSRRQSRRKTRRNTRR